MWWLVSLARAEEPPAEPVVETVEVEAPAPIPPPPPAARVEGATLVLSFGGTEYALSQSKAITKPSVELHFEQPFDEGYNQLWLVVGKVKPGRPSPLEGYGMGVAFVQIQPDVASESSTRNVSASCGTKGTVTFDTKPKPGATASGQIDVTITCDGVPELSGPIAIRGAFSGLPVQ